jgi:hypothetical protein
MCIRCFIFVKKNLKKQNGLLEKKFTLEAATKTQLDCIITYLYPFLNFGARWGV